jgi:hypothetical protein
MHKKAQKALLLLSILLLGGCAGQWIKVSNKDTLHKGNGYQVLLPNGWVKLQNQDTLLVTRDGPDLQRIQIRMAPHEKAFVQLEKASDAKQVPSELADLFMADLRKQDQDEIPSLEVLANEPVSIAGHDAFRIHVSFRTGKGLRMQAIAYGFVTNKHFVSIVYAAPTLHYFDRDRAKVDSVVNSLQLG